MTKVSEIVTHDVFAVLFHSLLAGLLCSMGFVAGVKRAFSLVIEPLTFLNKGA